MMSTKKVKYNETNIDKLPNDKPVVYKIFTEGGNNNYTGETCQTPPGNTFFENHQVLPYFDFFQFQILILSCPSILDRSVVFALLPHSGTFLV